MYEEATTTCSQRLLNGFSLEMLNEALVRYGLATERSRRKAADALAEKNFFMIPTITRTRAAGSYYGPLGGASEYQSWGRIAARTASR